jgi:hypothetical protein
VDLHSRLSVQRGQQQEWPVGEEEETLEQENALFHRVAVGTTAVFLRNLLVKGTGIISVNIYGNTTSYAR